MLDEKEPLASFENLRVEFDTKDGKVVAVEDISFEIKPKQTVCLVGESGYGKSVSSLSMMRLVEFGGGSLQGGKLILNRGDKGKIDVAVSNQSQMRKIRGKYVTFLGLLFRGAPGYPPERIAFCGGFPQWLGAQARPTSN